MNEEEEVAQLIKKTNPQMVEKSVWSANGTDYVIAFPVKTAINSKFKKDLMGVKQLEFVKIAQQNWVENGTNIELCTDVRLRHNVSNTISVDNWDEVEQYIFDNRQYFAGISLLASGGDKSYVQAPFTEVFEAKQILKEYGEGSMFASGLIVEALRAYNENLWQACDTVTMNIQFEDESATTLLKRDWVRRATKYADNYFGGDLMRMTHCLKDCYNLHKWNNINRAMVPIDFSKELTKKSFTDVDTLGSQGCYGGSCEISFA
jgi:ribonucleoside-diphosphate reductase alpha chain